MKQIPDFMIPSCASPFTEGLYSLWCCPQGEGRGKVQLLGAEVQLGAPEGRRWLEPNRAELAAVTGAR